MNLLFTIITILTKICFIIYQFCPQSLCSYFICLFYESLPGGDAGAVGESRAGRKWKKPFPAKVSGSERLVHYNGLMDPPGCLLSLHYIGEMLTKSKLTALLVSSDALYSVV